MHSAHVFRMLAVGRLLAFTCSVPALGQAVWSRNFDDGTLLDGTGTPMIPYDPFFNAVGIHEFSYAFVDGSVRLGFNGLHDDSDSGLLIDPRPVGGTTSALVLLRFSTNPLLATTPTNSEINAGWLLRVNLDTLSGYVCVLDDRGYLQLQRLAGGEISDLCEAASSYANVPEFDVTRDWWLRTELVANPDGSLTVRARAWLDGTPEPPCTWLVQCQDTNPYPAGLTALVANEDKNLALNYLDVDNASITAQKSCVEVCGNGTDDDADELVDCHDPDCDASTACACRDPFGDLDEDGDIDQVDFGAFQRCLTISAGPAAVYDEAQCGCLDRDEMNGDGQFSRALDGDGDVDEADLLKFIACAAGPAIAPDPACDNAN